MHSICEKPRIRVGFIEIVGTFTSGSVICTFGCAHTEKVQTKDSPTQSQSLLQKLVLYAGYYYCSFG